MSSKTPSGYGTKVRQIMEKARESIRKSQQAADDRMEKRLNPRLMPEQIAVGDQILLKRTQSSTAKAAHLQWIGPFLVVNTNATILRIRNDQGMIDFVHRIHAVNVVKRNPHLNDDVMPVDMSPGIDVVLPETKTVDIETETRATSIDTN